MKSLQINHTSHIYLIFFIPFELIGRIVLDNLNRSCHDHHKTHILKVYDGSKNREGRYDTAHHFDSYENRCSASHLFVQYSILPKNYPVRKGRTYLPDSGKKHPGGDIERAYDLLIIQWLDHMLYLKNNYPCLFLPAHRTNPFDEKSSSVIE